ncbi:MAG: hypothetical protein ACRYG8_00780 [Janthinobacterium lividum]
MTRSEADVVRVGIKYAVHIRAPTFGAATLGRSTGAKVDEWATGTN